MSTHTRVDPTTLGWVKSEIDETLKQARLALESFAENPTDKTRLRFCLTHLHQVVGTLLMVELDGAAQLAAETEQLAEALNDDRAANGDAALEALTRAILTLPDYLARLQAGEPDVPLRQLPLLNELRAARGVEPLSGFDLFAPDLSVRPPRETAPSRLSEAEYATLARELRPRYQNALLQWLRGAEPAAALAEIAEVFGQLQEGATLGFAQQLFWVAGGLTEMLADAGVEASPERKKLFARLDQQIKKIMDGADRSASRKSAEELTRSILYEVGSADARGARVTELKRAFGLEQLLGAGPAGEALPSPEALESVAQALGREIETAQDLVAAYFDPAHRDDQALARLIEQLRKMGGILDMLGVGALKRLVDELAAVARAMQDSRLEPSESVSLPMAQALLQVESSARDFRHSAQGWQERIEAAARELHRLHAPEEAPPDASGIEVAEGELSESDFRQLAGVVGEEIGVNLARIEEAIESFAAAPGRLEALDPISALLGQVVGALQILAQERAATFAEETRQHIEAIREGRLRPETPVLDGLAVSVGTIGAYLEGLRNGRTNLDSLLNTARREMRSALRHGGGRDATALYGGIGTLLESFLAAPRATTTADDLLADLEDVAQQARLAGQGKVERIASEMNRLVRLVLDGSASLSEDIARTLRQSGDALVALGVKSAPAAPAAPAPVAPAAATPAPAAPVLAVEADPEIVQIFIEDARDVLRTIRREFENWRTNPENNGALLELRRGYHTLKGSGRMVGATEIAELAWAIENMLNRLRDGKIKFSGSMPEVLAQAQEVLPVMVGQLEGGPPSTADIPTLRARAEALARGVAAPELPPVAAPAVEPEAEARVEPATPATAETETVVAGSVSAETGSDLPALDQTLLDIFINEARGHLATLGGEIASRRSAGAQLVSDPFYRAVHTLLGNARSLGVAVMAEPAAQAEKLLLSLRAQHLPLEEAHLGIFERLHAAVSALIERLGRGERTSGELRAEFDAIAHAAHGVMAGLPPEETAHEPTPQSRPAVETHPAPAPKPAVVKTAAPPAEVTVTEKVDPELLEVFQEEAVDILGAIDETLARWRAQPAERGPVFELKRSLHTLKGGARMAGSMIMGELAHHTETLLKQIEDGNLEASGMVRDLLDESHDMLVTMLDRLREGRPVPTAQNLNARLLAAAAGEALPAAAEPAAPAESAEPEGESLPPEAASAEDETITLESPVEPLAAAPIAEEPLDAETAVVPAMATSGEGEDRREDEAAPAVWPETMERRGQVRVNTHLLNQLVNFAGEVSIARSRMEQQIYGFRDNLAELKRNVTRFRDQIRDLEIQSESQILYRMDAGGDLAAGAEFDPLEFDRYTRLQQLSRSLAESLHDLTTIQGNLGSFVGEAETVLAQQARLNTDLQEGLMRTRMVAFSTQAGRLRHLVRTTARELGKRVELELQGAEVELDRTVLERMIGPFEHMVRNSVDHGIEAPEARVRAGKPPEGRITITAAQEAGEIVIRFADDGAGLNIGAIRAKAVERGLIKPDANLSEDELIQFILVAGFSTATRVTAVSGRGVGMDVVHSEVKQLGGTMSVETERGRGSSFVIRLPLTLSVTQALTVHVGDQQFAVPLASVVNIVEMPKSQLAELATGKNPLLNWNEKVYPFLHLGTRLGIGASQRNGRKAPVLLARAGQREIAIEVDALGGTREIVVKPLGPQLAEIKGLSGATILGDGRVMLILDVPGLWYREDALVVEHRAAASRSAAEIPERPVVMVVDDSLTVRKVTGKHLQKRGHEVMTAKDGVDAWEQLRERAPDIMLVDIEMPRMDGYELTQRVRADANLRHIPIIMITSRAGAKHRERAFELGVDVYMSKPYQEEELFQNIDTLLARGRTL
jgi:chemosensory pili system protein ChpA (sensor histidine kinase/response regulator)